MADVASMVSAGIQKIQTEIAQNGWCYTAVDDICAMAESAGYDDLVYTIWEYVDGGSVYTNQTVEGWMVKLREYVGIPAPEVYVHCEDCRRVMNGELKPRDR